MLAEKTVNFRGVEATRAQLFEYIESRAEMVKDWEKTKKYVSPPSKASLQEKIDEVNSSIAFVENLIAVHLQ